MLFETKTFEEKITAFWCFEEVNSEYYFKFQRDNGRFIIALPLKIRTQVRKFVR